MNAPDLDRLRGRIQYHATALRDLYEDLDAIPESEIGKYAARSGISDAIDSLDGAYCACPRTSARGSE
jgi:hypothetical protein